ncbi:hypothetical protein D3C71_2103730 [compost metagenome]
MKNEIEARKKTTVQMPFLAKSPNIGSNKPNSKTVKIALPNKILSPKPIGNITINGAMIAKAGMLKIKFTPKL